MKINAAIVSSMINTGKRYGQLEQFSAILNMPSSTYQKRHANISCHIDMTMWQAI